MTKFFKLSTALALALVVVGLPLLGIAAGDRNDDPDDYDGRRFVRVRDEDGASRIVIRNGRNHVQWDEDELEEFLESLEDLDVDIEALVENALEGLDGLDLNFAFDFDNDLDGHHGKNHRIFIDDDDFDFSALEGLGERISAQLEAAFDGDHSLRMGRHSGRHSGRGHDLWDDEDFDDDDADELRAEMKRLERKLRKLERKLEDVEG